MLAGRRVNAPTHRPTNRLAAEPSPYLRQHAHNPVDWYGWGDEAFARARQEQRPIFLSVGYSTCHWCHVMERESFESEAVARVLNEHFVSIKVDREERPDVDRIYMQFVQATTGQGGWPLSVFLAPDLKPFYGGTYFPPDRRHGRPAFLDVLEQIASLWGTRRAELVASAGALHARLQTAAEPGRAEPTGLGPDLLHRAARRFKDEYDPRHGGFGGAPKFPRPSQPLFLLRYGVRFQDQEAIDMVVHTCARMAAGGLHDQLGGGFARYAVDAGWQVPHFEKMLYDNAQLLNLYLDAYLVKGEPAFAEVARGILRYVLRDLRHPDGGFFSAEDADSEGKEGKFYCWARTELEQLLSPAEFQAAVRHFGISAEGNFLDHSDPDPLPHQNVLRVVETPSSDAEARCLASAREKMWAVRSQRVRPRLDDKVLSSWNGLMLGALARACVVLNDEEYRRAAETNLAFLRRALWEEPTRTLYHRWREGSRDAVQLLEAYAFLLSGVLDLYEATLTAGHLEFAVALAEGMLARFEDREAGGFWQNAAEASDLILRLKPDYDGAEPSGNSVAILALMRLGAITQRPDFQRAADRGLEAFAERLSQLPEAVPHLLLAADLALEAPARVVVAGDPAAGDTRQLLGALHAVYHPPKVILGTAGPVDPLARTVPAGPVAKAYVCADGACQAATSDRTAVRDLLRGRFAAQP
jgi:uncharacterized protein